MKGFVYLIFIYAFVFLSTTLVKVWLSKYKLKNRGKKPSPPKIYYIENSINPPKKPREKSPNVAIKGSIIEKENLD